MGILSEENIQVAVGWQYVQPVGVRLQRVEVFVGFQLAFPTETLIELSRKKHQPCRQIWRLIEVGSSSQRIRDYEGRYSFVDGIPFKLPVSATDFPALMAALPCDYEAARRLMPGNELFPVRLLNGKAVFIVTIINYVHTTIGKHIEYSLALACTYGSKPAPRMLPVMFQKLYRTGQFILDLPVSTEISVKGGKGIWGMPKHQANLDFIVTDAMVSSQYEKDGQFAFRIEMDQPKNPSLHLKIGSVNYSHFRNMLMASYICFDSKVGLIF